MLCVLKFKDYIVAKEFIGLIHLNQKASKSKYNIIWNEKNYKFYLYLFNIILTVHSKNMSLPTLSL